MKFISPFHHLPSAIYFYFLYLKLFNLFGRGIQ
jgi:hypothetical protein